jgi:hypothetical protein
VSDRATYDFGSAFQVRAAIMTNWQAQLLVTTSIILAMIAIVIWGMWDYL